MNLKNGIITKKKYMATKHLLFTLLLLLQYLMDEISNKKST